MHDIALWLAFSAFICVLMFRVVHRIVKRHALQVQGLLSKRQ